MSNLDRLRRLRDEATGALRTLADEARRQGMGYLERQAEAMASEVKSLVGLELACKAEARD